jgi:hypothetical protein
LSEYIAVEIRRKVRKRFEERCAYCQSRESLSVVTFEVEHIIPVSRGGQTQFENLCLACPSCNRHKSNRVSVLTSSGIETRIFHPQLDVWLDHFDWSINGTIIVGVTDVGAATLELLKMNRPQLVEVRSYWRVLGMHPPN